MAERLQELLHQKALLNEQAAWLDREIVVERERLGTPLTPVGPPADAPLERPAETPAEALLDTPSDAPVAKPELEPPSSPSEVDVNANAILEQYRSTPRSLQQEVRFGCFLYFFAALVLLSICLGLMYLTHHGK